MKLKKNARRLERVIKLGDNRTYINAVANSVMLQ